MVWCRRRESEYSEILKTRNLLIFRDAKNAKNGKIAPNWNVSGTRDFSFAQPLIPARGFTLSQIRIKLSKPCDGSKRANCLGSFARPHV
jgi:hypothetical protein